MLDDLGLKVHLGKANWPELTQFFINKGYKSEGKQQRWAARALAGGQGKGKDKGETRLANAQGKGKFIEFDYGKGNDEGQAEFDCGKGKDNGQAELDKGKGKEKGQDELDYSKGKYKGQAEFDKGKGKDAGKSKGKEFDVFWVNDTDEFGPFTDDPDNEEQIGRASCRERV